MGCRKVRQFVIEKLKLLRARADGTGARKDRTASNTDTLDKDRIRQKLFMVMM
jgi:hypothetical protein